MNTKEIIDAIRALMAKHNGGEGELLRALMEESEGWEMRLFELEVNDEDEKD